jgi:hypothetical protein
MIIGINMIDKMFLTCPYCNSKINSRGNYFHCQANGCYTIKNLNYKYRIWHNNYKIIGYELWNETEKYYLDSFSIGTEIYSTIRIFNSFGETNNIYQNNFFIPLEEKVTDDLLDSYKEKIILLSAFQ